MKKQYKWFIVIILILFSIPTFWTLSFASGAGSLTNNNQSENNNSGEGTTYTDKDNQINKKTEEDVVSEYIKEIFFRTNLKVGTSKEEVIDKLGEPIEEGMYEGGTLLDYAEITYFVNPETKRVNAIAVPAEKLELGKWKDVEPTLKDEMKVNGYNEMEELWMEIYNWKEYDLMVERKNEGASPHYLWITEDSLFTE